MRAIAIAGMMLCLVGCGGSGIYEPPDPLAEVAVEIEAPAEVAAGEAVTVGVLVTNAGPSFLQTGAIRVGLDRDGDLGGSPFPGGGRVTVSDNSIEWSGFRVGIGLTREVEFQLTMSDPGPVTLTLRYVGEIPDPIEANNTFTHVIEVVGGG